MNANQQLHESHKTLKCKSGVTTTKGCNYSLSMGKVLHIRGKIGRFSNRPYEILQVIALVMI